ncbi:MAG TPA: nuclear transport factor 2 family protein [Candidatus Limnocylindrales bacterium]|nr:nuclear transport factor 2 family protein [Candidatus Limnocylindrales bacterium]
MTLTRTQVQDWLNAYVEAWRSYDPAQIGALFSADAVVYYTPYTEPVRGRAAIVADWLENPDPPGTWKAHYWPDLIEGDRAAARGRSVYFVLGNLGEVRAEFDNVFLLTFNDIGEVTEFREWYFSKPPASA